MIDNQIKQLRQQKRAAFKQNIAQMKAAVSAPMHADVCTFMWQDLCV